jgi:hypothetical protein
MTRSGFCRFFLIIIMITTIPFISCNKKTETPPDFPQLMGGWSGTTSTGNSISFWVNSLDGTLILTTYDLWAYVLPEGLHEYRAGNENGLTSIINKQFKIILGSGSGGQAFIDGTFNINDMSLYGTYAVYSPTNNVDRITGTYTAMKNSK